MSYVQSPQNFAHAPTAMLSVHVQISVVMCVLCLKLEEKTCKFDEHFGGLFVKQDSG